MFTRRLLYWISVAAGLVLAIVPLPDWLDPVRPDLALLAVIYWILTSPRIAGLGYAWLSGLFLDVLRGMVLGQHALGFLVVAFLTHRLQNLGVRVRFHGAAPGKALWLRQRQSREAACTEERQRVRRLDTPGAIR